MGTLSLYSYFLKKSLRAKPLDDPHKRLNAASSSPSRAPLVKACQAKNRSRSPSGAKHHSCSVLIVWRVCAALIRFGWDWAGGCKTHERQPIGDKQKGSEWTGFSSLQLVRLRSARARKRLRRRQMQALLRRQTSDPSAAGMRILCSIVSSSTKLRSQASLHPENRTFFSYPRCACLRGGRATASATTGSRASAASSPTIKRTAKKQIWSEIGRASAGAAIVCAPQRVAAQAVTWKQVHHVFVA